MTSQALLAEITAQNTAEKTGANTARNQADLTSVTPVKEEGNTAHLYELDNSSAIESAYILGQCEKQIWGLSASERTKRVLARFDVKDIQTFTHSQSEQPQTGRFLLVRADYVYDENLICKLLQADNCLVLREGKTAQKGDPIAAIVPAGKVVEFAGHLLSGQKQTTAQTLSGLPVKNISDIVSDYNEFLRKKAKPFAYSLEKDPLSKIEKDTFRASYKGATDFVTKFIWPWPARHVTKWCALLGIRPNTVTTLSLILCLIPIYLWAEGYFWMGVILAWLMTFLDTVDGKLARVTLTSSKWGNLYDHGIDLIHPPFWWAAWWMGAQSFATASTAPYLEPALWIIVSGYVLGRVMEGIFLHGFGIQTHIWNRADYYFRIITARRNPNLFLLMASLVIGRPDSGLLAVALWTVLSLGFHFVRLLQAAIKRFSGEKIVSYLSKA